MPVPKLHITAAGVLLFVAACSGGTNDPTPSATVAAVPAPSTISIGESVDIGLATITFVDADFKPSRSELRVEMLIHEPASALAFESAPARLLGIVARGVDNFRTPQQHQLEGDRATGRYLIGIEAGPALSADAPVEIEISHIRINGEPDGGLIEGPWIFAATADSESLTAGRTEVAVGKTMSAGPITIRLDELLLTPDETLAFFNIDAPADYAGWVTTVAHITLPDGTSLRGREEGNEFHLAQDKAASFEMIPEDVTEFDIGFGPFLMSVPGDNLEIPLPQLPDTGNVALDHVIPVHDWTIVAKELRLREDNFTLTLEASEESQREFGMSWDANHLLRDDLGNFYSPSGASVGFKTENGEKVFGSAELSFIGPLDPAAQTLTLTVSEFSIMERGPWDFHITLPE